MTTSMVRISMVMPPKTGMAMGIVMSEPRPDELSSGSRARIVVAVVIRQGRMRRLPAAITALRISGQVYCSISGILLASKFH